MGKKYLDSFRQQISNEEIFRDSALQGGRGGGGEGHDYDDGDDEYFHCAGETKDEEWNRNEEEKKCLG